MQAEALLKKRGFWDCIDHVVIAEEGNEASEGMRLAAKYEVDQAPFFIVNTGTEQQIYTQVFQFIKNLEMRNADPTSTQSMYRIDIAQEKHRYSNLSPQEILAEAQDCFGVKLAIAFSGAEDVVLIDMAVKNKMGFSVFCLDTGRLHPETYNFIEQVREHYACRVEIFFPSPEHLEPFVREKGLNSFYHDGHKECCNIRKVEPLSRALANRKAWATGMRKDQSPATRHQLSHIELDTNNLSEDGEPLIKFNPLLNWSSAQVWEYIRENRVPYNVLHDSGYKSIGCAPCTRASRPGEHERMARWWWEESTQRECGLHVKSK